MKTTDSFEEIPLTKVRDYWNSRPCNIRHSPKPVGSREYFDEVEARKYFVEPHIPKFAEFGRWRGKKVLEIGCGIGTDTISFAAAGAQVTAVDLTEKSLEVARQRAKVFGVEDRVHFIQANAEKLSESVPVSITCWSEITCHDRPPPITSPSPWYTVITDRFWSGYESIL